MSHVLDFLALALVHGTIAALLAWALDAMLRARISPALSCALWTVALAKFFVPVGPAWTIVSRTALSPGPSPALSTGALPALLSGPLAFAARGGSQGQAGTAPSGLPWATVLFALYLAAVAVLAVNQLFAARRLASSIRSLPEASPAMLTAVRVAAAALKLRRVPAVRIGQGPFVAGALRPTLVMPSDRCDTPEARAMILHELAHLRRGDPWVRALQNLAQLVFFFWPPIRWVNRRLEQHRELACDQLALEHGALTPAAYARVLLEAQRGAVHGPWQLAALEMSSQASRLERRIDMVLNLGGRRPTKWAALAVICGAGLALSGGALAVDAGSSAPTSSASPTAAANAAAAANATAAAGATTAVSATNAAGATNADDEAAINHVVREHGAQIRACYEAQLLAAPGLEGKLVFGWSIKPDGTFGDGCVTSSDFSTDLGLKLAPEREDELQQCVSLAIRHWRFVPPKGGEKLEVSYPFVFKQAGGAVVHKADKP